MLESPSPPKPFLGVSFFLIGFDPDTHRKIRAKLVSSGGVDAGQCGPNCTHVIVGRIVYDDPICVAARNDGKVVVTGLWVDHSYDIGMPADTSSIMYKPVRDLNGIPGAKDLVMCLTGYQRQDREDIMMMVSFMGAQFSKPLVANKVTHLLCYKFEGEKYELAKKMKKIKLVNHRWLEDCLRDWEILPEANYSKSTYELEMVEAEVKDSEEDNDNKFVEQPRENVIKRSPTFKVGTATFLLPTAAGEPSKRLDDIGSVQHPSDVPGVEPKSTPTKETRESSNVNNCQQMLGGLNASSIKASSPTIIKEASEKTPSPAISQKGALRSPEASHIDAKLSSLSYSRKGPRRTSLGMQDGIELGKGDSSKSPTEKGDGSIGNLSIRLEQVEGVNASDNVQIPSTVNEATAEGTKGKSPQKRKLEVSSGDSMSQKMNQHVNLSTSDAPITSNRTQVPEASALAGQPVLASAYNLSLGHEKICPNKIIDWDAVGKEVSFFSSSNRPNSGERQGKSYLPSKDVGSGTDGDKKTASPASEIMPIVGKLDIAATRADETVDRRTEKQALKVSSSRRLEEDITIATIPEWGNGDMLDRENEKVDENQTRKTMVAKKKTLGSRPKLCKSANLKGSIYLKDDASLDNTKNSSIDGEEMTVPDNSSNRNDGKASSPHRDVEALDGLRSVSVTQSRDMAQDAAADMDDETEAPDEDNSVPEKKDNGENSKRVETAPAADAAKEEECAHDAANMSDPNAYDVEKASDVGRFKQGESVSKGRNGKGKSTEGRKPSTANRKRKVPLATKERVDHNGTAMEEKKRPKSNGKTKSERKFEISSEAEKENKVVVNADHSVSGAKMQSKKASSKFEKIAVKMNHEPGETNANSTKVVHRRSEPARFILSGHRQQRKEFKQVIRKLKGKFCRDSHQWSYQATHFITPGPIRRTEKFFAAAASGRWILKADYLSACNQAGKFLDEEPHEWRENGQSAGTAINLEAPRKWRLLRERTGHGAFYDMRIIIHGVLIAPSLDTFKRVVKAGDGTILATSPPYNRFLSKGVDFAIVGPGMPKEDIWVQEFLKHEIPCVLADYLVEYVCKPGEPLEKHVLYNTHAWAESSFSRLQRKAEEIVVPESSDNSGDLSCAVCGSTDRGDVMLVCGDDTGTIGCGIGTHIDCCDPPLKAVPEEDWLCPVCSGGRDSYSNSGMKRKREGSVLRSKQ
ncbi:BRCT domain-containing protein At4g02110 [Punica granatum]|uniref:Uncharacterized protein n=2 Tax=Punica granatum TaxID=22663 RepID=A0A218X5Q6_PUNGR|nr:BRCT domain-containing protein At4g02110 [Punica granatum]OWM80069.1 hypothetical protein CDL15_Pgr010047 [Punica granatum]PKI70284.1 hypothetical protein CRG98_009313 [Punica granatum]